jgi:hypothetical protein
MLCLHHCLLLHLLLPLRLQQCPAALQQHLSQVLHLLLELLLLLLPRAVVPAPQLDCKC